MWIPSITYVLRSVMEHTVVYVATVLTDMRCAQFNVGNIPSGSVRLWAPAVMVWVLTFITLWVRMIGFSSTFLIFPFFLSMSETRKENIRLYV